MELSPMELRPALTGLDGGDREVAEPKKNVHQVSHDVACAVTPRIQNANSANPMAAGGLGPVASMPLGQHHIHDHRRETSQAEQPGEPDRCRLVQPGDPENYQPGAKDERADCEP